MTDESRQDPCATRRCVLLGAGVLGAAGVLSACSTAAVPYDAQSVQGGIQGAPATLAAGAPTPSSTEPPKLLAAVADIPVGGGTYVAAAQVVVTQPAKGQFKAFSAFCTHVGCPCTHVENGTINCPCHGSRFSITDGAPVPGSGPAQTPLGNIPINVTQGNIFMV
jgi:Rieske Fe-S protein